MAWNEIERKRVEKVAREFVETLRPPAEIRSKLDIGFRLTGQSVEIFEIRPSWDGVDAGKIEHGVAKATYVAKRDRWRVFWKRADLKWHRYDPAPEVRRLEDFLALVERDEHACFFG